MFQNSILIYPINNLFSSSTTIIDGILDISIYIRSITILNKILISYEESNNYKCCCFDNDISEECWANLESSIISINETYYNNSNGLLNSFSNGNINVRWSILSLGHTYKEKLKSMWLELSFNSKPSSLTNNISGPEDHNIDNEVDLSRSISQTHKKRVNTLSSYSYKAALTTSTDSLSHEAMNYSKEQASLVAQANAKAQLYALNNSNRKQSSTENVSSLPPEHDSSIPIPSPQILTPIFTPASSFISNKYHSANASPYKPPKVTSYSSVNHGSYSDNNIPSLPNAFKKVPVRNGLKTPFTVSIVNAKSLEESKKIGFVPIPSLAPSGSKYTSTDFSPSLTNYEIMPTHTHVIGSPAHVNMISEYNTPTEHDWGHKLSVSLNYHEPISTDNQNQHNSPLEALFENNLEKSLLEDDEV